MLSLSPAKLLIVLVIALIVLGPDKLPQLARRAGALWGDLRRWRARLETEVRSTFPDLPPTHEVVRAVRSPLSFLDGLADAHESGASNGDGPAVVTTPPQAARPSDDGGPDAAAAGRTAASVGDGETAADGGTAPGGPDRDSPDTTTTDTHNGSGAGHDVPANGVPGNGVPRSGVHGNGVPGNGVPGTGVHRGEREAGATGGTPGWGMDDPAMN